jgi:outer membrane lipoprotein SlyB
MRAVHALASVLVITIGINGCGARVSISPEHAQSAQLARDQRDCEAEVQRASRNVATAGTAPVMSATGAVAGAIVGAGVGLGIGLSGDDWGGTRL